MSLGKHLKEHAEIGIDNNAVQTVFKPAFQVFMPFNETAGLTIMCPYTGIVSRLATLGASAWRTNPDGRVGPGLGTGEHLVYEDFLSGEIPYIRDNQTLIMTTVWGDDGVGGTSNTPTMSYGESGGSGLNGVTFCNSAKLTFKVNNGQGPSGPQLPPLLDAVALPVGNTTHSCQLVLTGQNADGTRTARMYINGELLATETLPANYSTWTAVEQALNMSQILATVDVYCCHWALYDTPPPLAYETYIGTWIQTYVTTNSATGEKAHLPLLNGLPFTNMEFEYPNPKLLLRTMFNEGVGPLTGWTLVGDPINYNGTGLAVGAGTGVQAYNTALRVLASSPVEVARKIIAVVMQVDTAAGGISIIVRSNATVGLGSVRVIAEHDGASAFSLSIQTINAGFTWDTQATATGLATDFRTLPAVITITDDGATVTAQLNTEAASLLSYATTVYQDEPHVGIYTEDGDGDETKTQWHDFAVFDNS